MAANRHSAAKKNYGFWPPAALLDEGKAAAKADGIPFTQFMVEALREHVRRTSDERQALREASEPTGADLRASAQPAEGS